MATRKDQELPQLLA